MGYDLFISHTKADKRWVQHFVDFLREKGLKVFWGRDSIDFGSDFEERIKVAIRGSEHVVLVVTPESMDSRWVTFESSFTVNSRSEDPDGRLIPILLRPTPKERLLPNIEGLSMVDCTDPEIRDEELRQFFLQIGLTEEQADDFDFRPELVSMDTEKKRPKIIMFKNIIAGLFVLAFLLASTLNRYVIGDSIYQAYCQIAKTLSIDILNSKDVLFGIIYACILASVLNVVYFQIDYYVIFNNRDRKRASDLRILTILFLVVYAGFSMFQVFSNKIDQNGNMLVLLIWIGFVVMIFVSFATSTLAQLAGPNSGYYGGLLMLFIGVPLIIPWGAALNVLYIVITIIVHVVSSRFSPQREPMLLFSRVHLIFLLGGAAIAMVGTIVDTTESTEAGEFGFYVFALVALLALFILAMRHFLIKGRVQSDSDLVLTDEEMLRNKTKRIIKIKNTSDHLIDCSHLQIVTKHDEVLYIDLEQRCGDILLDSDHEMTLYVLADDVNSDLSKQTNSQGFVLSCSSPTFSITRKLAGCQIKGDLRVHEGSPGDVRMIGAKEDDIRVVGYEEYDPAEGIMRISIKNCCDHQLDITYLQLILPEGKILSIDGSGKRLYRLDRDDQRHLYLCTKGRSVDDINEKVTCYVEKEMLTGYALHINSNDPPFYEMTDFVQCQVKGDRRLL